MSNKETPSARISQQELAQKLGLSKAAVSLALRGKGNLSEATRKKILDVAASNNYAPDPLLGALSAYRRKEKTKHFQGNLAAIFPANYVGKVYIEKLAKAVEEESSSMGYTTEFFSTQGGDEKLSPRRLADVLMARGIRGLIISERLPSSFFQQFPWDNFSIVSITRANAHLPFDVINHDATIACHEIFSKAIERGYSKISFVIPERSDANLKNRLRYTLEGLRQDHQNSFTKGNFITEAPDGLSLTPDKLISKNYDLLIINNELTPIPWKWSGRFNHKRPALAAFSMRSAESGMTGIHLPLKEIARAAIQRLDQCIRDSTTGLRPYPQTVLLSGRWVEGKTMRVN